MRLPWLVVRAAVLVALAAACSAAAPSSSSTPASDVPPVATAAVSPLPSPTSSPTSSTLVLHVLADFRSNDQGGSLQWTPKAMSAPADEPFQIAMKVPNDTAHNLWIEDATGTAIFKGGDGLHGTTTYDIPALAAGTYAFVCTYHRTFMTGTLTVH